MVQVWSVDVRDDPVGNPSAVGVPGQAVFGSALPLVSRLPMDQQDGEINDVEIRQNVRNTCRRETQR